MLSRDEYRIMLKVIQQSPPPYTFDIDGVKNPERAKKFWGDLSERGYVRIEASSQCGFERVIGTFVSFTEAGLDAIHASRNTPL